MPNLAEIAPAATTQTAEPVRRGRRRAEADGEPLARPRALARAAVVAQPKPPVARKATKPAAPHEPPPREIAAIPALAKAALAKASLAKAFLAKALAARALSKAAPEPCGESSQIDGAEARQARHRRILERYVHGDALKPGERWKRRLQRGRK